MRPIFLLLALVATLTASLPHAADAQPAPVEINVILPLTGPVSLLGQTFKGVIDVAEKHVNRSGGINGRPVRFVLNDDTSNPSIGVQLANQLVQKRAPVVIGSAFLAVAQAMAPLTARSGPVMYTLVPIIHPAPGGYVFAAGASSEDDAQVIARYLVDKNIKRVATITTTDSTGTDMDEAFNVVFGQQRYRDVQLVAREHYAPGDISVSAQLARIKASNPDAIITWSVGTPFGTVLRGLRDSGLDALPIVAGNGNMLRNVMAQLKDVLPRELIFPGYRSTIENESRSGPIHDAQQPFYAAFREGGLRPDVAGSVGWDVVMIVVDALRKLGPDATATQIRDYLGSLTGYAGINAVYDFRGGNQRGAGANALIMQRWDPAKNGWYPVSRPGGAVR